jgi:tRNA pseudouridine55 synthase
MSEPVQQSPSLASLRPTIVDAHFSGPISPSIDDYPDGLVFVLDKPYRWTSSDVVRKMKFALQHHFHKKNIKVGHAGTLDPLATGILLVCCGRATKLAETFQAHDKEYVAEFQFGATTPTFDLEQPVDRRMPSANVTRGALESAIPAFIGEQEQIPPVFSAKMVDGVRAYQLARNLQDGASPAEVGMKPSHIRISAIEILSFGIPSKDGGDCSSNRNVTTAAGKYGDTPLRLFHFQHPESIDASLPTATLRICCSKGTYIRAIARDFGEAMGTCAYMSALTRSASGEFRVENALTLDSALAFLYPPRPEQQ